jgi:hypothetical protein
MYQTAVMVHGSLQAAVHSQYLIKNLVMGLCRTPESLATLLTRTRSSSSEPSQPYTSHDLIYRAESNATPLYPSPDVNWPVPKVSVRCHHSNAYRQIERPTRPDGLASLANVGNLSPVTQLREPDSRCAFIRGALVAKCTPWIRTTLGALPIDTVERSRIRLPTKLSLARISVRKLVKEAV